MDRGKRVGRGSQTNVDCLKKQKNPVNDYHCLAVSDWIIINTVES